MRAPWIRAAMAAVYAFLFLPIVAVVLMSFNASPYGTFPFEFTTKWYAALFSGSELGQAALLSVGFSLLVTLAAVAVGLLTALAMARLKPAWAAGFSALLNAAIIIPWLVLGVAMLILFSAIGVGRTYVGMFFGNLVVVLPYVVLLVYPAMTQQDRDTLAAARILGAKPVRAFFSVTLPGIAPAVAAGALMALVVCFNNFVIQYYLAPFGVRTLPMEIYNLVRVGYKPDINALASIMAAISAGIVLLVYRLGLPVAGAGEPGRKS